MFRETGIPSSRSILLGRVCFVVAVVVVFLVVAVVVLVLLLLFGSLLLLCCFCAVALLELWVNCVFLIVCSVH